MKDENFQPIMDRLGKRCNDGNERDMSHAAKEVLVKSVIQALPTFTLIVFENSKGFCDKYKKMIHDIWRGDGKEHSRKVH